MHGRLIVGFDGSTPSAEAVLWAAEEAQLRDAIVEVISCCPSPGDQSLCRAMTAGIRAVVASTRVRTPDVEFEETVAVGDATDLLVERSSEADLVVTGRTGVGAITRTLLGSVADAVARRSHCPVVFVHAAPERSTGQVVVAVDGSEPSRAALDWAIEEAELRDAELIVVHAWWYSAGGTLESRRASDYTHVDAALVLDEAVEHVRDRSGCRLRGELIEGGAVGTVVDLSAAADLVVVGSRGRGSVASMVFGSVARGVSGGAHCPTVVVRAPHS
jgi:nucleotide-binding universal stress UspA family protein